MKGNRRIFRRLPVACLLIGAAACGTTSRRGGRGFADWTNVYRVHTNLSAGYRAVDHPTYDEHPVYGLEVEAYHPEHFVGYELGFSFAADDEDFANRTEDGDFYEGYLGLRKTWGASAARLHPYVGLGGTYLVLDREIEAASGRRTAQDTGAGGYARAGIYWVLGNSDIDGGTEFTLGVDLRGVVAEDIDFVQGVIFLGFGR